MCFSQKSWLFGYKLKVVILIFIWVLSSCGGSSEPQDTQSTNPVTTSNNAPIANAGIDQSVTVGATVDLNGTASSDADGDSLAYSWLLIDSPENSAANLQNQTDSQPSFVADIVGDYTLSLRVNDGTIDSTEDTVVITAHSDNVDITDAFFSSRQSSCAEYVGSYTSSVIDIKRDIVFTGDIHITSTNGVCSISSNEIPNHNFNDQSASFANEVSEQNSRYEIPVSPEISSDSTALNLRLTNAVFLNGATVDLLAAACYGVGTQTLGNEKIGCGQDEIENPWRYDPMSPLNNFGTDAHNAHPQPDGTYHYHGNPFAMFDQDCETTATASPVLGFAADGFPVYGSCFTDPVSGSVKKALTSYVLKNNAGLRQDVDSYSTPVAGQGQVASNNYDGQFTGDYEYVAGDGDLDECNGMIINEQYGYYITDSYPWVLACFKGQTEDSFIKGGTALKNLLHSHSE